MEKRMLESDDLAERLVEVFRALGDPVRLRLLGLVAERPRTGKELAEAVAVGAPTVSHHLDKLARAKLISVERAGQSRIYTLNTETLTAFARLAHNDAPALESGEVTDDERERAKVLRDFFDGDRLKQIPAQRKRRVIVLQHLVARFDPERDYTERQVSDLLKQAHEDFATLRRELIDYGFMTRAGGVYRVARDLPQRSVQVGQEITGDESAWLRRLIASTAPSA
jgi:hypothetical protein